MDRLVTHAALQNTGMYERMEDIAGQEVTITDAEFGEGERGEYVTITAFDEQKEVHEVRTYAMFIIDALKNAVDAGALPVMAKFSRHGRVWLVE